jgi:hypothetical protein
MPILTRRTFREEFHKLGVVNTRSENLRGKFVFPETRVSMAFVIVSVRAIYGTLYERRKLKSLSRVRQQKVPNWGREFAGG